MKAYWSYSEEDQAAGLDGVITHSDDDTVRVILQACR